MGGGRTGVIYAVVPGRFDIKRGIIRYTSDCFPLLKSPQFYRTVETSADKQTRAAVFFPRWKKRAGAYHTVAEELQYLIQKNDCEKSQRTCPMAYRRNPTNSVKIYVYISYRT